MRPLDDIRAKVAVGMWHRLSIFSLLCIYAGFLSYVYVDYIAPNYGYMGYRLHEPSLEMIVMGLALALLPAAWLPQRITRPSQVAYWLLYLLVIVPTGMIPPFALAAPNFALIQFQQTLLIGFAITCIGIYAPLPKAIRPTFRPDLFWIGISALAICLYGVTFATVGFKLRTFGFGEIYNVRAEYKAQLEQTSFIAAYAIGWLAHAINPLFMAHGFGTRRPLFVLIGLVGQVLIFSITGYKSVFLSFVLLAGIAIATQRRGLYTSYWLAGGTVAVVVLSLVFDLWNHQIFWTSVLVRRVLATPGLLSAYYFDYFSHHEHTMWAYGFMQSFIEYYGDKPITYIIGELYMNSPTANSNVNIWADGFANLGHMGILIISASASLLFWIFDAAAKNTDIGTAAMFIGLSAVSLSNSALPTTLVTHGLGLVILLTFFYPYRTDNTKHYTPYLY